MRLPGLRLAIFTAFPTVLNHREEVDKYLADREQSAADLRQHIISDPLQQQGFNEMRERMGW